MSTTTATNKWGGTTTTTSFTNKQNSKYPTPVEVFKMNGQMKTQPEVVNVERGRMLDTDNQRLNVKIKFGQFEMDFEWTLNTRTNWVHTDDNPTRLDGIKIDGDSFQIEKSANTIMFDFNFDETKIGEEIEDRKHIII